MTVPTFLVLPYPPSANRYWRTRVVTPKGRPPFVSTYVSEEAEHYKGAVAAQAMRKGFPLLQGPVMLKFLLVPHQPLDAARRARKDPNGWQYSVQCIDLDNAIKVLIDSLKGVAFEDDRWVQQIIAERAIPDDKGERVVVGIRPWVPPAVQPGLDLALPEIVRPGQRQPADDYADLPF